INMKCPKCQGEMEKGFLPDSRYAGIGRIHWVDKIVHFKLKPSNKMFEVVSYRCMTCGYLENYAK
ncbi:hypothetical protein KBD81_03420, partial [Candidatus Woesebacteria bacterium]|nr:hypothetical protein [Candidatus Woesebacteria bacterium]